MKTIWLAFLKGLRDFGEPIGVLVNSVLLLVVYIVGVGLTVVVARLFKKSFLDLHGDRRATTYWEDFPMPNDNESHYRQF